MAINQPIQTEASKDGVCLLAPVIGTRCPKMVRPVIVTVMLTLSSATYAELCKYVDGAGNVHYVSTPLGPTWRLVECYGADGQPARKPTSQPALVGVGPPSILPQCLDEGPTTIGVGPSARARECTRQYCARPEYQAKVAAYAMNKRQSETHQTEALTCITRSEQDRAKK